MTLSLLWCSSDLLINWPMHVHRAVVVPSQFTSGSMS